jgi:hypothetical protein
MMDEFEHVWTQHHEGSIYNHVSYDWEKFLGPMVDQEYPNPVDRLTYLQLVGLRRASPLSIVRRIAAFTSATQLFSFH